MDALFPYQHAIYQGFPLSVDNQLIDPEFNLGNMANLPADFWNEAYVAAAGPLHIEGLDPGLAALMVQRPDGSMGLPHLDMPLVVDPRELFIAAPAFQQHDGLIPHADNATLLTPPDTGSEVSPEMMPAVAAQQQGGFFLDAGNGYLPAQPLIPAPHPQVVPVANAAAAQQQGGIIPNAGNGMVQQQQQPALDAHLWALVPADWQDRPIPHAEIPERHFRMMKGPVGHEFAITQGQLWTRETRRLSRNPTVRAEWEHARKEYKYYNQQKHRNQDHLEALRASRR